MLLTLMSLVNMYNPNPPNPIPSGNGGGSGKHTMFDEHEMKARERKKRLLREDEEILLFIKTFLECN